MTHEGRAYFILLWKRYWIQKTGHINQTKLAIHLQGHNRVGLREGASPNTDLTSEDVLLRYKPIFCYCMDHFLPETFSLTRVVFTITRQSVGTGTSQHITSFIVNIHNGLRKCSSPEQMCTALWGVLFLHCETLDCVCSVRGR